MKKRNQRQNVPLAELHSHMWGAITADDYLDFILATDNPREWRAYEDNYERVYGTRPSVEEIIVRAGTGDPSARREFRDLFVLGEEDAGDFARFQATYDIKFSGRPTGWRGLDVEAHFAQKTMETQVRQGVRYAEQRNHIRRLSSPEAERAIDGILNTFSQASEGFQTRLAVSLDRADPWLIWDAVQNAALGQLGHVLT